MDIYHCTEDVADKIGMEGECYDDPKSPVYGLCTTRWISLWAKGEDVIRANNINFKRIISTYKPLFQRTIYPKDFGFPFPSYSNRYLRLEVHYDNSGKSSSTNFNQVIMQPINRENLINRNKSGQFWYETVFCSETPRDKYWRPRSPGNHLQWVNDYSTSNAQIHSLLILYCWLHKGLTNRSNGTTVILRIVYQNIIFCRPYHLPASKLSVHFFMLIWQVFASKHAIFGQIEYIFIFWGASFKVRHIRNGTELPPIAGDENYDSDYQVTFNMSYWLVN